MGIPVAALAEFHVRPSRRGRHRARRRSAVRGRCQVGLRVLVRLRRACAGVGSDAAARQHRLRLLSGRQPCTDEVVLGPVADRLDVEHRRRGQCRRRSLRRSGDGARRGIGLFPGPTRATSRTASATSDRRSDRTPRFPICSKRRRSWSPPHRGRGRRCPRRPAERYDAISGESIPTAPGGVGNLTEVRSLPRAISIFVVVLGLTSLAHALATTVGRRSHDLATLRSIGFTPRQTTACVVWQAVTIAAVALIVGIPLGLVLGRGAWWAAADPIGVRTDISRPVGTLVLVGLGTIIAGVVLAAVVAWPSDEPRPPRHSGANSGANVRWRVPPGGRRGWRPPPCAGRGSRRSACGDPADVELGESRSGRRASRRRRASRTVAAVTLR